MSDNGVFPYVSSEKPQFDDDLARDNAIPGYIGPLDLPQPGAGPVLAVTRFYRLYAKFSGRASRSEFWWVVAFLAVAEVALLAVAFGLGTMTGREIRGEFQLGAGAAPVFFVMGALGVLSILPWIALGVRRLHDANLPGPLYLIVLVPSVGSLALLAIAALPSKPEGARFDRIRTVYPSSLKANPYARDNEAYPPSEYAIQQHQTPFYAPGPPV